MNNYLQQGLWSQFGAVIDMFRNTLVLCPEETWHTNKKFFYTSYHCLVFLDYYLTIPPINYVAPLSYTIAASADEIDEAALDDIVPDRMYSKGEMLHWLQLAREKCRHLMAGLTEEQLQGPWRPVSVGADELVSGQVLDYSVLEILLFNMRHVQHHTAQLNLLLRQEVNNAAEWVSAAEDSL
ncbi:hypothetical protein ACTJJ0_25645 [Chitinophaga sp. 22321]|uniref:DinB family protein n=1 Tax=Chitinophaga hostae TaxID=2831022 RepID=A0ABS5J5D9_9BACT|nr:DinB family protein [Chitinophaga hostae]MBS0030428.1 DinB family protein [Chitinophaga hostae]